MDELLTNVILENGTFTDVKGKLSVAAVGFDVENLTAVFTKKMTTWQPDKNIHYTVRSLLVKIS